MPIGRRHGGKKMELSPEYWTLHKWLSKAWLEGIHSERYGFRPIGGWVLFGPDWQQKEKELMTEIVDEMLVSNQTLKEHLLNKVRAPCNGFLDTEAPRGYHGSAGG